VGEAVIIGVSKLEAWGNRLCASALPTESAPTNTVKNIDGKRSVMRQPLVEAAAFFGKMDFSLPQENALYLNHLRVFWPQTSIQTEHPLVGITSVQYLDRSPE
jgi:hypothetical protein